MRTCTSPTSAGTVIHFFVDLELVDRRGLDVVEHLAGGLGPIS